MSFPRYPAYKDSGVEWLGQVPGHWDICALKRIADLKSGESITAEDIEEDGEFPVFGGNGLRGFTTGYTHEGTYALVGRQGALCGNVNYATGKFWASEHAVVATPKVKLETHWLGDLMRAMNLNQYSVSAAQPGLSVEIVGNLRIPVPPASEQAAIASFLDHETAKIDALVAEQERLIELLKEKRQAVISHAVTKGLDPSVPMKDSGVEWLGEVPAHWTVSSLRHSLTHIFNGLTADQIEPGPATVPVTRIETISDGTINFERVGFVSVENARPDRKLKSGDICFSNINSLKMIGNCAIFLGEAEIYGGMNLLVLRPLSTLNSRYLYWAIRSSGFRETVESLAKPAINQASISQSSLLSIGVCMPPNEEQNAIATFIDNETAKIDALVAEAHTAISLFQERRTALISAAVTGQIDVRGWVPAETAG